MLIWRKWKQITGANHLLLPHLANKEFWFSNASKMRGIQHKQDRDKFSYIDMATERCTLLNNHISVSARKFLKPRTDYEMPLKEKNMGKPLIRNPNSKNESITQNNLRGRLSIPNRAYARKKWDGNRVRDSQDKLWSRGVNLGHWGVNSQW